MVLGRGTSCSLRLDYVYGWDGLVVLFPLLDVSFVKASLSDVGGCGTRGWLSFGSLELQLLGARSLLNHRSGRNVVRFIVALRFWSDLIDSQSTLHGPKQGTNGLAADGNFDLDSLTALAIDEGVSLAILVVDILGNVDCSLMALGAERLGSPMDGVWVSAGVAVGSVLCKLLHDKGLVISGHARDDDGGIEANVSLERGHGG